MSKPLMFIGSASESRGIVDALETELRDVATIERWDLDTFRPGHFTLEELTRLSLKVDFAVFVLGREDRTKSRGEIEASPRDNVVFEAGLFTAALGRERTFYLVPKEGTKIPSDWAGLGYVTYDPSEPRERDRVFTATHSIAKQVTTLGLVGRSGSLSGVEGHWWQFVENVGQGSILSLLEVEKLDASGIVRLHGDSWSSIGEAVARYRSRAAHFEPTSSTLHYCWEGEHARESSMPRFFGVGEIRFAALATDATGVGWYSTSPSADLTSTHIKATRYSRASSNEVSTLRQGQHKDRARLVKTRLRERLGLDV